MKTSARYRFDNGTLLPDARQFDGTPSRKLEADAATEDAAARFQLGPVYFYVQGADRKDAKAATRVAGAAKDRDSF